MKDKQKKGSNNWVLIVFVVTFVLSLLLSFISNTAIAKMNIVAGLILLILVVMIGILFDLVAIAVTVGNEEDFQLCLGLEGPKAGGKELNDKISELNDRLQIANAYGSSLKNQNEIIKIDGKIYII